MAGSAASIALTAAEYQRLSSLVRAGTTPQRLVRRARVVLGSASGLGSRALARREQLSRTTVRRWLARCRPGSPPKREPQEEIRAENVSGLEKLGNCHTGSEAHPTKTAIHPLTAVDTRRPQVYRFR